MDMIPMPKIDAITHPEGFEPVFIASFRHFKDTEFMLNWNSFALICHRM